MDGIARISWSENFEWTEPWGQAIAIIIFFKKMLENLMIGLF